LRWLQRYDELRQNINITKNVSLLPWVVCVSGISSYFDAESWWRCRCSVSVIEARVDETFWSWTMNNRDVVPVQRQTDEQYTSVNFRLLDEQLHQDIYIAYEARCYCFNGYWWNIFRHPSIIFLLFNLINEHSSSLHSFHRRLPHPDYSWNSELCLTTFRVNSEKLCNIVNCNSRLVMILLLWQPITICDYPSIPWTVTTFYPLQRTDVFFTDTYPTGIFYHSTTLPKLLLTTSNYLTIG